MARRHFPDVVGPILDARRGDTVHLRDFVSKAPAGRTDEYRSLLGRFRHIHNRLGPPHLHAELLPVIKAILETPADREGVVVEAGSFKGASAAKLSLACAARGRRLVIFDSFEGLPEDEGLQNTISGGTASFTRGGFAGSLDEVKSTIRTFGNLDVCEFRKGWFDDTMPGFAEPIVAAYVDVDLTSSTKTCLRHLYPLLVPGGRLFSQDGHLPNVIGVLDDDRFWETVVGVAKPRMEGLGTSKLVTVHKAAT